MKIKQRKQQFLSLLPGLALCAVVALAAAILNLVEAWLIRSSTLGSSVLAILVGATVRTYWVPGQVWRSGISFSSKQLLEAAIVLLGASLTAQTVADMGLARLGAIVLIVVVAIPVSFLISSAIGLPRRLAMLIACGNAICGNSAIMATAPIIGAEAREVASSVAFSAVLGIGMILMLPSLSALLQLEEIQFGVLAGLTVYAVPQVIAVTTNFGSAAVHVATVVKLVRVLMLGPVIIFISLLTPWLNRGYEKSPPTTRPNIQNMVPLFVVLFALAGFLRSIEVIPAAAVPYISKLADVFALVSMSALGLSADLREVFKGGGRIALAATLSMIMIVILSAASVMFLGN